MIYFFLQIETIATVSIFAGYPFNVHEKACIFSIKHVVGLASEAEMFCCTTKFQQIRNPKAGTAKTLAGGITRAFIAYFLKRTC